MCRIMETQKRTLRTLGKGPVRRNLFGPVDREQLRVEYQAALRQDLEEASQRWGFDFVSNKPLDSSDFQWEGIPITKVPLLYRSRLLGPGQVEAQRLTVTPRGMWGESPQSETQNTLSAPVSCAFHLEKTPERSENSGAKRKQTNITDFYQSKRRLVGMPRKSGE